MNSLVCYITFFNKIVICWSKTKLGSYAPINLKPHYPLLGLLGGF